MSRIAVIGMGARTPFGVGAGRLLAGLCEGRAAFAPYAPFAAAGMRFPVAAAVPDAVLRAGLPPGPDDRGAQLLEGAVRDALEDATGRRSLEGVELASPGRVALVAGTSSSGIGAFCAAQARGGPDADDAARYGSAAERVARRLGITGPVLVICSVCASGALAVAEAAQLVDDGEVDVAIAAGFDPLEPFVGVGFDSLHALTDVPAPFRAGRRGLALGEGAAAMVLTRTAANARGHVLGWGGSSDAHHLTAPDPHGRGVATAIERALTHAGLPRDAVDVVNAHGTGTLFNDAMECAALTQVFGPHAGDRPVYTVKGTLGHTLGAAGAIEAVVSLAAMQAQVIPPTVTSGDPDPRCAIDLVAGTARHATGRVTLSLSSAFGGTNCALLLGAA